MTTDNTDLRNAQRSFRPFNYGQRHHELSEAIRRRLSGAVDTRRRRMIDDRSALAYRHGREWSLSHSPEAQKFSQLETISAETSIWWQDVVDHKLAVIDEHIHRMADEFERQFFAGILKLVDGTTEVTGNVVHHSGDTASDLVRVLEKIELGCDRCGRPMMPELHTSPQNAEHMQRELGLQPAEFWDHWEELRAKKEAQATAREAEHVSRFRC
jgi:hypothetical protein